MNKLHYKIVIPVDFSESPLSVKESLNSIPDYIQTNLYIIHVCLIDETTEDVSEKLNLWANELREGSTTEIRNGRIAEEIISYAEEINSDMILVPISNSNANKFNYLGIAIRNIIIKSNRPVFIFRNHFLFDQVKTILLPLDIDKENKLKLASAVFFARFFNQVQVRIVSVVFDLDTFQLNRKAFRMQHLVNFIEKTGIPCVGEIVRCFSEDGETIGQAIVEYADRSEAEIVLLATIDEEINDHSLIDKESEFMISNLTNNIISLSP